MDTIISLNVGGGRAKIFRKGGIFSLAIFKPNNIRITEKANKLFCELLVNADK